jgi:quercetin dioxygenase-like cupin family protein
MRICRYTLIALFALSLAFIGFRPPHASAQTNAKFVVKPIAEKKITQLPSGPLYWRIEYFPTLDQAKAAESTTALAAEVAGKAWLFTLGSKGGATAGGTQVAEIGPVPPPPESRQYLLRINDAGGPPGAKTKVHTHPGTETFYVLQGELSQKTPAGVMRVKAGEAMPGRAPGSPMQVSSSGTSDLNVLVMFVVDAGNPFSSPAQFK